MHTSAVQLPFGHEDFSYGEMEEHDVGTTGQQPPSGFSVVINTDRSVANKRFVFKSEDGDRDVIAAGGDVEHVLMGFVGLLVIRVSVCCLLVCLLFYLFAYLVRC